MRLPVLALAAALLCAAAGDAAAHAVLVSTEPADGAILDEAPKRLVLTFDEPVTPVVVTLVDATGHRTDIDDVKTEGPSLTVVPPPVAPGTSVLSWRVVSADGHPVGGALVFSVGHPTAAGAAAPAGDAGTRIGVWATRAALYALLAFGVGGTLFRFWVSPEPPRDQRSLWPLYAWLGWGLWVVPLALGFHGLDLLGAGPRDFMSATVWRAALSTTYAQTVGAMVLAFLAALAAVRSPGRSASRALSLIALTFAALAPALSGHAASTAPQWLTRPALVGHVAVVIFWAGALAGLAGLVVRGDRLAVGALLRFSRAIPLPLAFLIVSGMVLAVVQVEHLDALRSTAYGRLLLAKLAAVLALLAIAALNRFSLMRRVAAGEVASARALLHAIAGEIVLVLVIFGIVAGWRFTPPPRAIAAAAQSAAAVQFHLHAAKAAADVRVTPEAGGRIAIAFQLMDASFAPLATDEVVVILSSPEAGIGSIRRPAAKTAEGGWRVETAVPPATRWTVRIAALISDFDEATIEGKFDLPPPP
jgi:copper transport protein